MASPVCLVSQWGRWVPSSRPGDRLMLIFVMDVEDGHGGPQCGGFRKGVVHFPRRTRARARVWCASLRASFGNGGPVS